MARATLEIIAYAVDRASPVLNRIGESGRVAAQRVATAWNTATAPFTAITRRIKLVETALFAFLGSQAIRGLDRFFDKFGGAQYDAARSRFVTSMQKLGESLGKTIGPKFSEALDKLSAWVDRNSESIVKMFSGITDAILGTISALASLGGWLDAWRGANRTTTPQPFHPTAGGNAAWVSRNQSGRVDPDLPGGGAGLWTFNIDGWRAAEAARNADQRRSNDLEILRRLVARGPRGGPRSLLRESGYDQVNPEEPGPETFMDRLRNEWTETTRDMEERGLHLARTFQYSLGSALTDAILGVEKASEAFKAFARSVVRAVVEMFVDSAVRRLLGFIVGGIGSSGGESGGYGDGRIVIGGGPGTLGLGGGGGGGGNVTNIYAIDTQSFAQAQRRAEMERGATSRITQSAANHNPAFRRALQLR